MNVLIFGLGLHIMVGIVPPCIILNAIIRLLLLILSVKMNSANLSTLSLDANCQLRLGEHRKEDFLYADLIIKNPAIRPDNYFLTLNSHINYRYCVSTSFS